MTDILNNQFVSGGILLGALTAILVYCKSLFVLVYNKLVQRFVFKIVIYDYDELFYALEEYLNINYSEKARNLEASYDRSRRWVEGFNQAPTNDNRKKKKTLYWKQEPNFFTIIYKSKWLFVSKQKKELQHAVDMKSALNFHYSISGWRAKSVIMEFLQDVTKMYNNSILDNRISVFISDYKHWNITSKITVKTLDKIVLNKETKDFLINDINTYISSKEWYQDVNIPYKRSYLLYGPPGTGKTTISKAIASYASRDLCYLNINSVSSDEVMMSLFAGIPENCILLIEDIDCSFNQRESNKEVKVTFACLLNCLDGVLSKDGIITIITTNHIEKLDSALIRAGRVDVRLEIPLACKEDISEYLSIFYSENVQLEQDICLNMSLVQEKCIQNKHNKEIAITEIYKEYLKLKT